jgi:hypothetical protein
MFFKSQISPDELQLDVLSVVTLSGCEKIRNTIENSDNNKQ